jgi:hypothetical protein
VISQDLVLTLGQDIPWEPSWHPGSDTAVERRRWIEGSEKPLDVQPGSKEIEAIVTVDRILDPSVGGTACRLLGNL